MSFYNADQAIEDEAITTWTYNEKLSAKNQLEKIINWHVQVALDPKVNGGKVLVDEGRVDELEAAFTELEHYKKWFKDHATVLATHRIGGYSFVTPTTE